MSDAPAVRDPRRWRLLAAVALAFWALRLVMIIAAGWSTADEAWVLQIVARTRGGELLYRDVFFNCTPLVIYLARAACAITGDYAVTLKAFCAAFETGTFLCTLQCLRELSPKTDWHAPRRLWVLAVVMLLIPIPFFAHLYNDLATLMVVSTQVAVLRWRKSPRLAGAAFIGILLGLAVGEKQNVGAYLSLAAAATMLFGGAGTIKQRLLHVCVTAGLAVAILALVLLPTFLGGATHEMITDTLLMKGQYLHAAGINFFTGFAEFGRYLDPGSIIAHLIFPLALLTAVTYVAGMCFRATRHVLLLATPFFLVLVAGIYPRADAWHVAYAFPAMVLTLAIVGTSLPQTPRRALANLTRVTAAILLAALLSKETFYRWSSPGYVFSQLPHLRGILLHKDEEARLTELAKQLSGLSQPLFILHPDASGSYLISGTRNPTAYDYAIASELPPGAQQAILEQIQSGQIRSIVLLPRKEWGSEDFVPDPLQAAVERDWPLTGKIGRWEIRTAPK